MMLAQPLSKQLQALSRQEGVTLFMTLLAAFAVLLSRYSGQVDLVIGTPIANRHRREIEEVMGFFVNTLALHVDLSGEPSFRHLLGRVREVALGAYAHQDLPFEKLVEVLQPERDLSRTPIFQVFFNMLNFEHDEINLPGLETEVLAAPEVESKFDITLYAREQKEGIQLELVYAANLFNAKRMAEMSEQFDLLLSQIVRDPEEKINHYSLVTGSARHYLPDPTQALGFDWEEAVHTRFSTQARRTPEKLAVVDTQDAWTYDELDARSNQLANYLRTSGIRSQEIVAIYGHRSASLVWALLGVLKAGAAFTILDPAEPTLRIIDYLRVLEPRGWIQLEAAGVIPDALADFLPALPLRCSLELPPRTGAVTHSVLMDYPVDSPEVEVGPDDLAYIAFTSGTTGKPRGILGPHAPVSHFLQWHCQTFG